MTTPLPRKPTGKLAFAYQTIATLEQARADLEAENKRLREALTLTFSHLVEHIDRWDDELLECKKTVKAVTGKETMNYFVNPRNVLPNGLTLLQVNPDCAAQLESAAKDYGWLYAKGADNQWVTLRKLSADEIETAHDQAADMAVLQGTRVRAG